MRIHAAIEFAAKKHKAQLRKGTQIPYIVHPMEVMQILTAAQATEDMIIAGILHDTVEDTDATIEEILELFGEHVAELVAGESEDKSKTWRERKAATIARLHRGSEELAVCCLADKLSNLRSIAHDLQEHGEATWRKFNSTKEEIAWYYRGIEESTRRFAGNVVYDTFRELCVAVFGLNS